MSDSPPAGQAPAVNPFATLQRNASNLFEEIFSRHPTQMQCKAECSQCCHAEFSIFTGEASLIFGWFDQLSRPEREALRQKWAQPPTPNACAFLVSNQCTIYQARPIICRTQGAPLQFTIERKKEVEQTVDACRLNFDSGNSIPKNRNDWFDLDRLTELQSIAENFFKKSGQNAGLFDSIQDNEGRVSLRNLKKLLNDRKEETF